MINYPSHVQKYIADLNEIAAHRAQKAHEFRKEYRVIACLSGFAALMFLGLLLFTHHWVWALGVTAHGYFVWKNCCEGQRAWRDFMALRQEALQIRDTTLREYDYLP